MQQLTKPRGYKVIKDAITGKTIEPFGDIDWFYRGLSFLDKEGTRYIVSDEAGEEVRVMEYNEYRRREQEGGVKWFAMH